MTYLPEILIAVVSGGLGAVITGFFNNRGKGIESRPSMIEALSKRINDQETRLDELNNRLNVQQMELQHWKEAYSKLVTWLQALLKRHDITEDIPEFHQDKT